MSQREDRREIGGEETLWRGSGRTHVGLKRSDNQDTFSIGSLKHGEVLAVVADGMGGSSGGEVASRLALEAFTRGLHGPEKTDPEHVREAIDQAHRRVRNEGMGRSDLAGMGTTLVTLIAKETGDLLWGNVGDSRLYRVRNGEIEQISNDHSFVANLVRQGEITPEEAETHPRRNVLTMALGVEKKIDPEVAEERSEPGDRYLLCSDGLYGMVPTREILRIVSADWDINARCDSLIEAALDGGGSDNITVLLLERHPTMAAAGFEHIHVTPSLRWLAVPVLLGIILLALSLFSTDGGFGAAGNIWDIEYDESDTASCELDLYATMPAEPVVDSLAQPTPGDIVGETSTPNESEEE